MTEALAPRQIEIATPKSVIDLGATEYMAGMIFLYNKLVVAFFISVPRLLSQASVPAIRRNRKV